jgi:predicted transcriptional regulator
MRATTQDATITDSRETVAEMMRLLICSDLRKNLILSLKNGPTSLADLRDDTESSSTAAIHALRELERAHVTKENEKRQYALTNIGQIIALKLDDLVKTITVLNAHSKFWLEHDLTGIPENLLSAFGSLEESYLVTSTPTDIFKVYSTFTTLVDNAKEIKGISPIFVPDLINVFVALLPKEKSIELIVTSEVLDKMIEMTGREELAKALNGSLTLLELKENPKVGLTVTDYFLSLGFLTGDGVYDFASDLLSYSSEAIVWGNSVFDYYAASSELVILND